MTHNNNDEVLVPEMVLPRCVHLFPILHNRKLYVIYGRCIFVHFNSIVPSSNDLAESILSKFILLILVVLATVKTMTKYTDCLLVTWSIRHKQNSPADADKLVFVPIEKN